MNGYQISRRGMLLAAGAVAGGWLLRDAAAGAAVAPTIHLAATDGFISLPGNVAGVHPDPLAPAPFTTWGIGFRDVTALTTTQVKAQKGRLEAPAPMWWVNEMQDTRVQLTNLGLAVRPDLLDSHTVHWHGFRNAIPLFDGVPELSVAVPPGRAFTYFYRPRDPGTYMYHCHFEDVEHVSMGMTGIVFVRPKQNAGAPGIPAGRYVYNDGDGSTAYAREWGMFLSEAWTKERFEGAHIQEHDWSEYDADVWLLNGRSYPDTLAPNGGGNAPNGDLIAPTGHPKLKYQPLSSLVRCMSGEKVLLRLVNLGFQQHTMTLAGIPMRVVGKDATLLRGRDGTDNTYVTNAIHIGPGESVDAIFTAPPVTAETVYLLYNRAYATLSNPGLTGLGGQVTQVRVLPAGSGLPPQTKPNT